MKEESTHNFQGGRTATRAEKKSPQGGTGKRKKVSNVVCRELPPTGNRVYKENAEDESGGRNPA